MSTNVSFLGLVGVLVSLAVPAPVSAQQSASSPYVETVQELVLNDGSRVYGVAESENDTGVVFRTVAGATLTALRERIVSLRPVKGRILRGEFRREDPNDTRLLFGPTGRSVPQGQVYVGVYQLLMPFIQVGITDRLSMGGGTPLVFNVEDWERLYWVTPKLQVFSHNGLHGAAGVFHGFTGDSHAGIAYGVVTKELRGGAFTAGAGLGYSSDAGRGRAVMVGGEAPVRRNIKFIAENYVWNSAVVSSGGFRFFGERLSADVGVAVTITDGGPFAVPIVNFVYRF